MSALDYLTAGKASRQTVSIDSAWFARHVYKGPCTVHVLRGRLKFPGYANVAGQGHMLIDWHGGSWGGIRLLDWRKEAAQ